MIKMQLTKIIATVRDDFDSQKVLDLYKAWVDVVRLNFTHATPASSKALIEKVKEMNAKGDTHLSILLDTKGPDIRTGVVAEPLQVKKGQSFKIFIEQDKVNPTKDIFCDYETILEDVTIGQEVIVDSGLLVVVVKEIAADHLVVEANNDASIGSRRHINLPGVKISLPALIEKDKEDILFGIKMGINFVAASFIRNAENVHEIRTFLDTNGGEHIKIISKIENQEALENLEGIVKNSDGVMVARGDLGIEMPIHQLPVFQKEIIDVCFQYGKPVIIATELLKSMVDNPFPTRAEVSDVYNSVIMRADTVMLSDETAIGKYPVQSVDYMMKTVAEAEKMTNNKHKDFDIQTMDENELMKKSIARYALMLADDIKAKVVIAFSYSENLIKYLSAFKPNQPVISFTTDASIDYSLGISYGVFSQKVEAWSKHSSQDQEMALEVLKNNNTIQAWDTVVFVGERIFENATQPQIRVVQVQ